jgi:hypothetical protein
MNNTQFIFYLCIIASGFLLGALSYTRYRKLRSVTLLLTLTFISEITAQFCAVKFRNNMPVYHLFSPLQLLLLGLFFFNNLEHGAARSALPKIIIAAIAFSIINAVFIQGINAYPSYFFNIESLIVILYSSILFIQYLERPSEENIFKNPVFIADIAILWFYIFSFLYFLVYDYFVKMNISRAMLRTIQVFSNYIYYLMLFYAMLTSYLQTRNDKVKP